MKRKTLEEDIESFLGKWSCSKMLGFMQDVHPLFELFDVDDSNDWVRDRVGDEDTRNVRLIRAVYLMSKIAETHGGLLYSLKSSFPGLCKKMEGLYAAEQESPLQEEAQS